jgi:hypothetical protein
MQWGDELDTYQQNRLLNPSDNGARLFTTCGRNRAIMAPQEAMTDH